MTTLRDEVKEMLEDLDTLEQSRKELDHQLCFLVHLEREGVTDPVEQCIRFELAKIESCFLELITI